MLCVIIRHPYPVPAVVIVLLLCYFTFIHYTLHLMPCLLLITLFTVIAIRCRAIIGGVGVDVHCGGGDGDAVAVMRAIL